jgi:hypothetical protein
VDTPFVDFESALLAPSQSAVPGGRAARSRCSYIPTQTLEGLVTDSAEVPRTSSIERGR